MSTAATWTEDALEEVYPDIPWRQPMPTHLDDGTASCLACRFCIALVGMMGSEIKDGMKTPEEFAEHMKIVHGREALPPAREGEAVPQ